jgi:ADP-ribose pyrophosphatase
MADASPHEWGHWEFTGRRNAANLRIVHAKFDTFIHPVTGNPLEATVIEGRPWCNIVAITPDDQLVMVRQFRFGVRDVTLEIPGGLVDPGEDHGQAARRELFEETGYASDSWTYMGNAYQNPGIQNELCHLWLATNALHLGEAGQHDGTEHIAVDLMSKTTFELPSPLVVSGTLTQSPACPVCSTYACKVNRQHITRRLRYPRTDAALTISVALTPSAFL